MNEKISTCRICRKAEPVLAGDGEPDPADDLDDPGHGRCLDGMIGYLDRPSGRPGRRTLADALREAFDRALRAARGSRPDRCRLERDEAGLVGAIQRIGNPVRYTAPGRDDDDDPAPVFFIAGLTHEGELFHFLADLDEVLAMSVRVDAHDFDPEGRPLSG